MKLWYKNHFNFLNKGSHTCNILSNGSILIFGREGSLRIQRKYGNCFLLKGSPSELNYIYEEFELDTASRSGHVCLNLNKNKVLLIGGRKDKIIEIHSFPTAENSFLKNEKISNYLVSIISDKQTELKNTPSGRRFAAAVKIDDFCLIHAGETFDSHFREPRKDLLLLNLSSLKFYNLGDLGVNLQNHTICDLNNRYVIHGGSSLKNKMNQITYELCAIEK